MYEFLADAIRTYVTKIVYFDTFVEKPLSPSVFYRYFFLILQ